ncbi:MAG: c-type cytochrome [Paracoccaceae bacterium]
MLKTLILALAAVLAARAAPAGDLAQGRVLAKRCAACHGIDGLATMPMAPNIAGHSDIYLVKQLRAFRSGERQNQMMSVVAGPLTDAEIDDLAAWYSAIEVEVTLPE